MKKANQPELDEAFGMLRDQAENATVSVQPVDFCLVLCFKFNVLTLFIDTFSHH